MEIQYTIAQQNLRKMKIFHDCGAAQLYQPFVNQQVSTELVHRMVNICKEAFQEPKTNLARNNYRGDDKLSILLT